MSVPVFVQATPAVSAAIYSTARTLTFAAPVTAGSTILVMGHVRNINAASLAGVTASVSMTGAVFIRRADAAVRYDTKTGVTLWQADEVTGGATAITVTPTLADAQNYCDLVAIEISGCHPDVVFEAVATANAEYGAFNLPIGPAPTSGSISQADTMAVVITFTNDANQRTNIGWQTPSGWTERAKTISNASGQRAIWVGTKTQTATTAVSVTVASTEADIAGRSGALLLLRGITGDPSPPPPAPAPSPPPPAPGPAPSPPPPGPAPAPAAQGFEFLNVDALLAGVVTDLTIQIHATPTTEELLGTYIQSSVNQSFLLDGDYSKVLVEHDGVVPVTTGQPVVAVGQNATNTAGFRGVISGIVVDL